jgi:hypothetical protein
MRDRLLTIHFLERFLENDLVSPDADRHGTAAMVLGSLLAVGLFLGFGMSIKYLQMPLQSPARTAVLALGDRFALAAISMVVTALAAVAAWDALSLDARDTAILGPLPIARGAIVRAKLRAVAIFAATFALAIGALSGVVQPMLMAGRLPIGLIAALTLVVIQEAVTLAAALFAFASVVALREVLRALLGTRFARVSAGLQAVLIVLLVAGFLLLPAILSSAARDGGRTVRLLPPAWFVGVQEAVAGDLVFGLPRPPLPASIERQEDRAAARYRELSPQVRSLAWRAALGLGLALAVALGGSLWNSRRLPLPPAGGRGGRSRARAAIARAATFTIVRSPASRAGFFLALHCLARSAPHRVVMAGCTAVSLALAIVFIGIGSRSPIADVSVMPHSIALPQTLALLLLLAGFRHAMRLPADVRANRLFRLAWLGQSGPFVAGVRRAALAAIVLPVVLSLLPVHVYVLGWRLAVMHLASGMLLGAALVMTLMGRPSQLPLAANYVPGEQNTLGPAVVIGAMIAASLFAQIERLALAGIETAAALWVLLLVVPVVTRVMGRTNPELDLPSAFEPAPPGATRLDLG